MRYHVLTPLLHDGSRYDPPAAIALGEAQAAAHLAAGRVRPVEEGIEGGPGIPVPDLPDDAYAENAELLVESAMETDTRLAVMLQMLATDPYRVRSDLWTKDGRPDLFVLNKLLADAGLGSLKAAERDRLWASLQSD